MCQSLNQLVRDVSAFQVGENEDVGLACYPAARSLLLSDGFDKRCICLKLTLKHEFRSHLLRHLCGTDYLVNQRVLCAAHGGEAEEGDLGFHTDNSFGGAGSGDCYLGKFLVRRIRVNCA